MTTLTKLFDKLIELAPNPYALLIACNIEYKPRTYKGLIVKRCVYVEKDCVVAVCERVYHSSTNTTTHVKSDTTEC